MATKVIDPKDGDGSGEIAPSVKPPTAAPNQPQPTREPKCDPADSPTELAAIFKDIRKERERPLFVLISDSINADILNEVYSWKSELRQVGEKGQLDILIHSPGGTLTHCYMIARLFSRYTNSWEALVPSQAASGATLICLGSSNIVMTEISQLGPLDPQVISKRREKFFASERQSPLEAFEAVQYLREFGLTTLDTTMKLLLQQGVTPERAIKTARDFSVAFIRPVLEKIEPYDLGAFKLDSRLAKTYCQRIACSSNTAKKTQRNVNLSSLVELYPAHEFAIDVAEAKELGFNVSRPSQKVDEHFDRLRGYLSGIETYVGLIPDDGGSTS